MRFENMFSNRKIPFLLRLIGHDKDQVKTREKRRGHVDLIGNITEHIEAAVFRVSSPEKGTPGLKCRGYSGFRNTDGLLLHCFVKGRPVLFLHFIHFIDSGNTHIGKHKSAGFQVAAAFAKLILDCGCGKTSLMLTTGRLYRSHAANI